MFNLETVAASILSSSITVGVFIFILKNYFLNQLNKDLENHKFSLQREVIKAQLVSSHSADIYKRLFELIEIDYGTVMGKLSPLQLSTDWSTVGADDIEQYLIEREASLEAINEIPKLFKTKSINRIDELNKVIKLLDNHLLNKSHQDARNYLISNSLMIEQDVEELAFSILSKLQKGCTGFHMWAHHGNRELMTEAFNMKDEIRSDIDKLKLTMKSHLMPIG